jgi:hypothetical protein
MPAPTPNKGALIWFDKVGPGADIPGVHTPVTSFQDFSATSSTSNGQVIQGKRLLNNFMVNHSGVKFVDCDFNGKTVSTADNLNASVSHWWCRIRANNGNPGRATGGTNTELIRCEIAGYVDGTMHKYGYFHAIECLFHSPLDSYGDFFAGKPLPNTHPDPIQQTTNTTNSSLAPRFLIERCAFYSWPWWDHRTNDSAPVDTQGVPLKTATNDPSYWRATSTNDALSSTSMIGLFKIEGGTVGATELIIRDCYAEGRAGNGIYLVSSTSARHSNVAIFDLQVSKAHHPWSGSADGQGYCQTRWLSVQSGQAFDYGRVVDADTGATINPSGYNPSPAGPGSSYTSWFDTHPEIDDGNQNPPPPPPPPPPGTDVWIPEAEHTAMVAALTASANAADAAKDAYAAIRADLASRTVIPA